MTNSFADFHKAKMILVIGSNMTEAHPVAAVKPAMLMYTLGITEHICGVKNVLSCANLVRSRRGKVNVSARVTGEIPQVLVWMAFHFRECNANWLANPAYDPMTLTAEYKACAVAMEKLA